jgi:hypothetical protein
MVGGWTTNDRHVLISYIIKMIFPLNGTKTLITVTTGPWMWMVTKSVMWNEETEEELS